jgi:predicted O-methyltransferase YrrM
MANIAGLDIHKYSPSLWKWSHTVDDYYPVDPVPRWGHDKAAHGQINAFLIELIPSFLDFLDRAASHHRLLASVAREGEATALVPFWKSEWLQNLDAVLLMVMLAELRPKTYLEIGSGVSTKFARHTIKHLALPTKLISIDPEPRYGIDGICDQVIRKRLEDCELTEFDALEAGDILFFDGSHRTFQNSDVTVFFLDIMPRLKPGVIVHIHDIFLPWDYPTRWMKRMYSEQYMLAMMLLYRQNDFKMIAANFFMCQRPELKVVLEKILSPLGLKREGLSFWMEKLS